MLDVRRHCDHVSRSMSVRASYAPSAGEAGSRSLALRGAASEPVSLSLSEPTLELYRPLLERLEVTGSVLEERFGAGRRGA